MRIGFGPELARVFDDLNDRFFDHLRNWREGHYRNGSDASPNQNPRQSYAFQREIAKHVGVRRWLSPTAPSLGDLVSNVAVSLRSADPSVVLGHVAVDANRDVAAGAIDDDDVGAVLTVVNDSYWVASQLAALEGFCRSRSGDSEASSQSSSGTEEEVLEVHDV